MFNHIFDPGQLPSGRPGRLWMFPSSQEGTPNHRSLDGLWRLWIMENPSMDENSGYPHDWMETSFCDEKKWRCYIILITLNQFYSSANRNWPFRVSVPWTTQKTWCHWNPFCWRYVLPVTKRGCWSFQVEAIVDQRRPGAVSSVVKNHGSPWLWRRT